MDKFARRAVGVLHQADEGLDSYQSEVMSRVPRTVKAGGFSPMVAHAVPPDVPLSNFPHYLDLCKEIYAFDQDEEG